MPFDIENIIPEFFGTFLFIFLILLITNNSPFGSSFVGNFTTFICVGFALIFGLVLSFSISTLLGANSKFSGHLNPAVTLTMAIKNNDYPLLFYWIPQLLAGAIAIFLFKMHSNNSV